jgi:hypothetical protein
MSSFEYDPDSEPDAGPTHIAAPANIVRTASIDIIDPTVVRPVSPLTIDTHFDSESEEDVESEYEYDSDCWDEEEEDEDEYCHTYLLAPRVENQVLKEENWTIHISTGKTVTLQQLTYYRWCEVAATLTIPERGHVLLMSHIPFSAYNMVPVSLSDPWKYGIKLMNEHVYSDDEFNEIKHLRAIPGYCVCDYNNETGIISNQDFDDDDFFPEVMEINGWVLADTYHHILEGGCSLDEETKELVTHLR